MKKNLVLYVVLAAIIGLGSMGTYNAGSGHVETVKENVGLVKTNKALKQENQKLTTENQELKIATDSLITQSDSLKSSVSDLETKVDKYETKIQKDVDASDNDGYLRNYNVDVPIEEVSNSPN